MEETLLDTVNTKILTYFTSYSSFGLLLNDCLVRSSTTSLWYLENQTHCFLQKPSCKFSRRFICWWFNMILESNTNLYSSKYK